MWVGHGSLYRHFDKLGKEEQVQVLKDALGAYTLHNKPQTLHPQLQTLRNPLPDLALHDGGCTDPCVFLRPATCLLHHATSSVGTGVQCVYVHAYGVRADARGLWKPQGRRTGWTS